MLGVACGLIPFVGSLLKSFVDAYAYLMIASTDPLLPGRGGRPGHDLSAHPLPGTHAIL